MKIKLNNKIGFDLDTLLRTKLALLANSGGGKSWAVRRIVEQAFGHVQIIIIDPESEYANLRSEYDFVLAGEGGEVAAKPHIAAKLAERLMDMKASAIVDLYELIPQERKHFVRLFIDSLMNLPKHMQTDVLLVVDESHVFAPEGKPSEASTSMEALASQGRKRNIGAIFATQRIAKMSKDVLAECNNKMIGRMNLDIDRKRAGEELGFTTKDQTLSLRSLKAGEFYFFGPAVSDEIIIGMVGEVKVLPPKRGAHMKGVPSPTAVVKKMIAKLSDLPQEVQKEAQTVAELKAKIKTLEGRRTQPEVIFDAQATVNAVRENQKKNDIEIKRWQDYSKNIFTDLEASLKTMKQSFSISSKNKIPAIITPVNINKVFDKIKKDDLGSEMPAGEKTILIAIASISDGMTREHITVQTGYKRSTRDAYVQRLQIKGYVEVGTKIKATDEGISALGNDFEPLPTGPDLIEYHLKKLPEGESKILKFLVDNVQEEITRDRITETTGYQRSTRDAYLQRLIARQLVAAEGRGIVKAADLLFF